MLGTFNVYRFHKDKPPYKRYEFLGTVEATNGPDANLKAWEKWPDLKPSPDYPTGQQTCKRAKYEKKTCCGEPMKWCKGRKLYTDPKCKRGKAVRHVTPCGCSYMYFHFCPNCRKQEDDREVAPFLLSDAFGI